MAISLNTRLTELLGCRYPIIQTAMGWVADPKLVAATGNAGGFGFLAGATIEPHADGSGDNRKGPTPDRSAVRCEFPHVPGQCRRRSSTWCYAITSRAVSYGRRPGQADDQRA